MQKIIFVSLRKMPHRKKFLYYFSSVFIQFSQDKDETVELYGVSFEGWLSFNENPDENFRKIFWKFSLSAAVNFVSLFSFPQTFFMHEFSSVFEGFHIQLRCHATVTILQLFFFVLKLTNAHSTNLDKEKISRYLCSSCR